MTSPSPASEAAVAKMRAEGLPAAAVDTFAHYHALLEAGESGMLLEDELEPVAELPDFEDLPEGDPPLDEAVVIKLNGGLGTSMGMDRAKSLLEVKAGQSFLDIVARQVLSLRERTGARLPLVLMNSFYTQADSLRALERYPQLAGDVPADFVQNKEPKLRAEDLFPVQWPADPGLEWCPPGHGDLYTALLTSGMLETLLGNGYRYAFVSNSDNLGAVFEPRILAWVAREGLPFAMEAADRTEADRKGGHIARRRAGRSDGEPAGRDTGLVLRETAQTREEDLPAFQDITRHRFFNTNNLWVDLDALRSVLWERGGVLGLPMIVNRKTVDPADKSTPAVIQIESAMGAALDVFTGAQALRVPRTRFAPVKTTSDLLVLRSDAYELTEDARVRAVRSPDPLVELSDEFKLMRDFESRIPDPPSLVECSRLAVRGDVRFGRGVTVRGSVTVEGPVSVPDGAELSG